ncbi:MAG: NUDIX domain-containing protein [Deltaproteobacteria bacterium]|nr:NUDIX domain-containing protein [Deltaproteobacteria bacterium]
MFNLISHKMYAKKKADAKTRVRVGVGVVVRDNKNRILMEKRSDCSLWGLPGGKIEPGESVTQAALREVKEETGLDVEITKFIGIYSEPENRIVTFQDNGDVVHLVDVLLEAKMISGTMQISHESEALQFFDEKALPDDVVPPAWAALHDVITKQTGMVR